MSLKLQTIFTSKNTTSPRVPLSPTHFLKPPNLSFSPRNSRTHFLSHWFFTSQPQIFPATKINASFDEVNGSKSSMNGFNFDAFLSILEFLSLASSAAISVYVAMRVQKGRVLGWPGSRILVWQCVALVSGVVVGAVMRRRQWRRVCGAGFPRGSGSCGVNLLGRVEKLEEDLRSSATIIRVLPRQLEKLGIRVRVTRKTLKEPIAETAALAQKNSEATRVLAAQEDILEKELGEIQKVLLAMQEQQKKQLELILALGKAGRLFENKRAPSKDENASEATKPSVDGMTNSEISQIKSRALQKQANTNTA